MTLSDKNSSAKLVVDYAKSCWDDELKRFHSIDDKLAKLLRFITGVLVLFSSFLTWLFVNVDKLHGCYLLMISIVSLISLIGFLSALSQAYRGTQLMTFPRPPMNKGVLGLLNEEHDHSAKLIAETYHNVVLKHRELMIPKEKHFEKSYEEVIFSLSFFSITLVLMVLSKWS
jgi:hypothetical protein